MRIFNLIPDLPTLDIPPRSFSQLEVFCDHLNQQVEILSHVLKHIKQWTTTTMTTAVKDTNAAAAGDGNNSSDDGPLPCKDILDLLAQKNEENGRVVHQVCEPVASLTKKIESHLLSVGVSQTRNPSSLLPVDCLFVCIMNGNNSSRTNHPTTTTTTPQAQAQLPP